MLTIQNNTLQSLRAVEQFIAENATVIPGVITTGTFQRLTEVIAARRFTSRTRLVTVSPWRTARSSNPHSGRS